MFEIERAIIPQSVIDNTLRLINLELLKGFTAEQAREWRNDHHWFSHLHGISLGEDPLILGLARYLPDEWRTGRMDPGAQIVLQFPTENERSFEQSFHEDTMPDWPPEKRWRRIVGIALTPWWPGNGAVRFLVEDRFLGRDIVRQPLLAPGDAVMFTGDQKHGPSPNTVGDIRYGVYLRWHEDD